MRPLLSRLDPRAAPIITRLANLNARPSLNATLLIAAMVFVVSLAISAAYLYAITLAPTAQFVTGAIIRQLSLIVMVSASAFLLLMPAVVAGLAALLTARDVRSESFSLLRLTSISGQALFQAYVMSTLDRLRVLLAIAFGMIPLYAMLLAPVSLLIMVMVSAMQTPMLMEWDITVRLIYYALIGVGLWGMSLFAAVMGVNVGLRARSPILAASIAPVGVIVVLVSMWLLLNGYIAPMFSTPVADLYPFALPLIMIVAVVVAATPYFATLMALQRDNRPLPTEPDTSQI